MSNYLLEIGVEEFPAKHIPNTESQLKNNLEKTLLENNFTFENIKVTSTPRRLSLLIENIEANKSNQKEKIKGPSRKIAFDDQGLPSKALQGFMRSKDISLEDIVYEEINGEEYIYAVIVKENKKLDQLLKESVPQIIKNISNPRQMRWGGKNIRFLRPIRWIVSLLDDAVLKFDLEGIKVSNVTKGHRTLGSDNIIITSIDEYESLLESNYVIISEEKRKKMILRGINRLSKEIGGHYLEDEDLLEELVYINEYPTAFMGKFDAEYLNLPKEVIVTPMKDHQRYFPVEDDDNNLLPYFLGVRNGDDKGLDIVAAGNEKVLVARLEDAKFFYEKDMEKKLEEYVPELEHVGFVEGLGNMLDKTQRLEKLVETLGENIESGLDAINISKRAAYLAKADLVTQTVIEFTELQGIIGRVFAEKSGESPLVAKAIEEQYMPVKSGAALPETISGRILSIADKLDTITGLHSAGIEVTGSQDLYGQRRAVLGILNILIEYKINVDLRAMISESLYNYVDMFGENFDFKEVRDKVENFILGRFENLLSEKGFRYDIIDSVLGQKDLNIREMYNKVLSLDEMAKDEEDFEKTTTKYVRLVNISSKAEKSEVDQDSLLEEDTDVYYTLSELDQVDKLINQGNLIEIREVLDPIVDKFNEYLDNTHVMVEDENLKANRLAMVKSVADRILKIFDPRKIVR